MKNYSKKEVNLSHSQITEIEWFLVKAIELFYESLRPCDIKDYVQDYIVKFCYERELPIKETVKKVNELTKSNINIKMADVLPESKRGQAHLVNRTLLSMLNSSDTILDELKTAAVVNKFDDITGISSKLTIPIVNTFRKLKKRNIIEKELYTILNTSIKEMNVPKEKRKFVEMLVNAYSEKLKVDPKYIKSVLKNKKKKDDAERKRLIEYNQKQER